MAKVADCRAISKFQNSDKYVESLIETFKTRVQVSASPPRRSKAFCQPSAQGANGKTFQPAPPFPTNLLLCKIFAGALKTSGVLGAYFTRTSPPPRRSTAIRQQFVITNRKTVSGLLLFPKSSSILFGREKVKFCRKIIWGISSAGRAPGSQSGGQGFDPPMLHQA